MNYVRLVLFSVSTVVAFFFVEDSLQMAFSDDRVIEISGLLNIWASYAILLVSPYFLMHTLKNMFNSSWHLGNANKIVILLIMIVAPVTAMATFSQSKANVANYVECKHERKVSSRYSSRTYAINDEICATLKDSK
ncbi:hypothetical protein [Vibrio fluvialis]|uniref:hypothetical protein n=2 Tax=Vibrio fluvialis TaxID=676 RepID=UPI0013030ACE|nr:hypothetical protein [Vibrio fluvialis]EKO3425682.1 hypothetical protein [Vibrio fluvialis]EKO3478219.1 hypothetical protein [Vibrio fluvialis]ELS8946795.1 hypothetical protein [Vibrio fluvialis]MCE7648548.1 hypothetical protein [Vibrio fluvialis]MCG6341452.1 hypothetical protein [Vibrio fluvialis]